MVEVEELYKLLHGSLADEKTGVEVLLRPKLKVFVNKDFVEKNKERILAGIRELNEALKDYDPERTLEKGLSYINIAGCPDYHLEQREVLILLAVGRVLNVWDIFPDPEKMAWMFEADTIGAFPYNSGYRISEIKEKTGDKER